MIKQQLTQRQQQKLSPLQIQQIKLLELNGIDLETRIDQELEENPALEEVGESSTEPDSDDLPSEFEDVGDTAEDLSLGDYRTEDDIPDYKLQQTYYPGEAAKEGIPYSENQSLHEFLSDQLHLKELSEDDLVIGDYLIGNIDEDGYIRRELSAISDDLAFQYGMEVPTSQVENVLKIIQELDPLGVGARDLKECLLIQLKKRDGSPENDLAILILEKHFEAFSKKQYDKILKLLNIDESQLKEVVRIITLLNPRPGGTWESNLISKLSQITPDFAVEAINGELVFSMSDQNIPELRVSPEYRVMLRDYTNNDKKKLRAKRCD